MTLTTVVPSERLIISLFAIVLLCTLQVETESVSQVQISASPTGVDDGVTAHLTIKCVVDKPVIGSSLLSIIISRQPLEGNTQSVELASINLYDGGHVQDIGHTQAALAGSIAAHGASSISMSFSRPSRNETGLYVCQANVMDDLGHTDTLTSDALVQEEMTQIQQYTHTLHTLSNQIQGAVDCCSNLDSELDRLALTASRLTQALEYVQKAVLFDRSGLFAGRYYFTSRHSVQGIRAAQSSCEVLGGYLAEIQDVGEWVYVRTLLVSAASKYPNRTLTYLGAQDTKAEGSWFWTQSKTAFTFTAWQSGFPDDVQHSKNCLGGSVSPGRVEWVDLPCDVNRAGSGSSVDSVGFLCEVPV